MLNIIIIKKNGDIGKVLNFSSYLGQIVELRYVVERTWNPKKLGLGEDVRDLGVAIYDLKFLSQDK